MVEFNASKKDMKLIGQIADRAVSVAKQHGIDYPKKDAVMDIEACHCNGCPLRLKDFLEGNGLDFAHDVFGIQRNLNRKTGELQNFFSPRFAAPKK